MVSTSREIFIYGHLLRRIKTMAYCSKHNNIPLDTAGNCWECENEQFPLMTTTQLVRFGVGKPYEKLVLVVAGNTNQSDQVNES